MTSEEQNDISEQPAPTCPMIDEIILNIRDAERAIKGYEKTDDADELRQMIESVEFEIDIIDKLERIRRHVELIRKWGEEWKQLAISIAAEIQESEAA